MAQRALFPRQQTIDLLARTRNSSAIAALATGLGSASAELRGQCIKLLLGRPEVAARGAIVGQWLRLDPATRVLVSSSKCALEPACKRMLQTGSLAEMQAAIAAISDLDMTVALPELVALVLEPHNPICEMALSAVVELCDRWGQRARNGRDVPSVRAPMLEFLHRIICDYPSHHNADLVEAWLMLVTWEDSAQRALVVDPTHSAFQGVIDRLRHSQHQSVLHLLSGYLWRASTPKLVLSIICERPEHELAVMIATLLDDNLLTTVLRRLREMAPLASLHELPIRPAGVSPEIQRRLWIMLSASSEKIEPVVAGAVGIAKMGTVEARRTAADVVRNCRRMDVETLVHYMQDASANPDHTDSLGAHLIAILNWIGGSSQVLDAASREFYSEFTLARLLEVVRKWPMPMCRILAYVVSKTEPDLIPQLLHALECPAPKRRMIALQTIQLLDVANEIIDRLLPLIRDARIEVRVRTIELLSMLNCRQLIELLPVLLQDPTTEIQEAASRAQRRAERRRHQLAGVDHTEPSLSLLTPSEATR